MTLLQKARKKHKELRLPGKIELSDKKGKKLMLLLNSKNHSDYTGLCETSFRRNRMYFGAKSCKRIYFGAEGSITFLEGASDEKRENYRKRHKKIMLKSGKPAYKAYLSPAYLSWNILW